MLRMPASLASLAPISKGRWPTNGMFCFLDSSATAKNASRDGMEIIFMKLAPRFFSSSTAARASAALCDGILLGSFPAARSQERAGRNDMWTEKRAGLNVALPGKKRVEIAAHVAHPGNAVGEKQRQKNLFAPGRIGVDAGEMDVHVPEAR